MKATPLTPELYDYVTRHRSNHVDAVIEELSVETQKLGEVAGMQIAPEQGTLLTLLVSALGVKNAIEIGTFTGTSALCIARGLPADGRLLCLDISDTWLETAQKFWDKAGVSDKITVRIGNARQTVEELVDEQFDFAFIDADKGGYDTYYEAVLPRLKTNGVIIFDNMLRYGRVLNPKSAEDQAIVDLNQKLASDSRVQSVLLPLADGINICRKL